MGDHKGRTVQKESANNIDLEPLPRIPLDNMG